MQREFSEMVFISPKLRARYGTREEQFYYGVFCSQARVESTYRVFIKIWSHISEGALIFVL